MPDPKPKVKWISVRLKSGVMAGAKSGLKSAGASRLFHVKHLGLWYTSTTNQPEYRLVTLRPQVHSA